MDRHSVISMPVARGALRAAAAPIFAQLPVPVIALGLALLLAGCERDGRAGEESTVRDYPRPEQEAAPMSKAETETDTEAAEDAVGEGAGKGADALTGTRWWVEDIAGGGVIDRSRATVEFVEPGRVAGSGGCNRYMGGYELDGGSLSFAPLASTMMACPESLMNQEQRFHDAMGRVSAWRIDERTRLLHLLDEDGETVVRASRLEEEEDAVDTSG